MALPLYIADAQDSNPPPYLNGKEALSITEKNASLAYVQNSL
jgi:hypothetical protein